MEDWIDNIITTIYEWLYDEKVEDEEYWGQFVIIDNCK